MLALTCFKVNNASAYDEQISVNMLSSCDEIGSKIEANLKLQIPELEDVGFVSTQLAQSKPDNI